MPDNKRLQVVALAAPFEVKLLHHTVTRKWDDNNLHAKTKAHNREGLRLIKYLVWATPEQVKPYLAADLPFVEDITQGTTWPNLARQEWKVRATKAFEGDTLFPQYNVWGDIRSYLAKGDVDFAFLYLFKIFLKEKHRSAMEQYLVDALKTLSPESKKRSLAKNELSDWCNQVETYRLGGNTWGEHSPQLHERRPPEDALEWDEEQQDYVYMPRVIPPPKHYVGYEAYRQDLLKYCS